MTIQARKLREKLKLKDKKLHCCKSCLMVDLVYIDLLTTRKMNKI